MKQETKQNKKVAEQTVETVNSAVELSQKTANVVLNGAVKTAELSGDYIRNLIQVGLDAQEMSVNVAKSYFDGMAKINRQWINLFSATSEKTIESVGESIRKPIADTIAAGAEVIENASAQTRQAAK